MINQNSQPLAMLLALIAIIGLTLITQTQALAQDTTFAPGAEVMASPSMLKDDKYYRPCTVVKFDTTAKSYLLRCDGTEYYVPVAYIRAAKAPAPPEKDKAPNELPADKKDPVVGKQDKPTPNKGAGGFQVGERVMASPRMLKDDKYYQPCTVISINPPNSFGLRCDPFNGNNILDNSILFL